MTNKSTPPAPAYEEFSARVYNKRRYYTQKDVQFHISSGDLWVVIFQEVYDLTPLIQKNIASPLCQPLIDFGGKDISHFFDPKTKEPKTKIDTNTGKRIFYCPNGRYLHIPNPNPDEDEEPCEDVPWWRNRSYIIGRLTIKVTPLRYLREGIKEFLCILKLFLIFFEQKISFLFFAIPPLRAQSYLMRRSES